MIVAWLSIMSLVVLAVFFFLYMKIDEVEDDLSKQIQARARPASEDDEEDDDDEEAPLLTEEAIQPVTGMEPIDFCWSTTSEQYSCPKCWSLKNTMVKLCGCGRYPRSHFHFTCPDCGLSTVMRTADDKPMRLDA